MEFEKIPSRPVIPSQMAANAAVELWQKENLRRRIRDKDGFNWRVKVKMTQKPSENNLHESEYLMKLWLEEDATIEQLLKTGVLTEDRDGRMIALLQHTKIPFALKPVEFKARNLDEARNMTLATTDMIAKKMNMTSLVDIKRQLVCRFIESGSLFNESEKRL